MKFIDLKRSNDKVLAVWPEYWPWFDKWFMIEFVKKAEEKPFWRSRYIEDERGFAKADWYEEELSARAVADELNPTFLASIDMMDFPTEIKDSLRLKAIKATHSKQRLADEEKLMWEEGKRRHSKMDRPSASDLILHKESEKFRISLAGTLHEMPYLKVVLLNTSHRSCVLFREKDNNWTRPYFVSRPRAEIYYRARIANAYGYEVGDHWGKTKAAIREVLLPRANQLLKLASVQRLLAEALAEGKRALVCGNVVFWYEADGSIGWQVKTVQPLKESDDGAIWNEGTILSKNHGRIIVLPYIKENGERIGGHTKNGPNDGPAKPRHPDHYVRVPFSNLKGDTMIGLLGELPYE